MLLLFQRFLQEIYSGFQVRRNLFLNHTLKVTEVHIDRGRDKLKKAIHQQKLACLAEYNNLLKSEEERLLAEYDEVCVKIHCDKINEI